MPGTRELIQAAMERDLAGKDRKTVRLRLLPCLTPQEIDDFAHSLSCPLPDDLRDLLGFCSGLEGVPEEIDFTGRSLSSGFGLDFLLPQDLPIAHDGCGNYWVVDLAQGSQAWGPVYYCCHDAPVMLVQSHTVREFVEEILKTVQPPHLSLIDAVREDRLFRVWRENPGVTSLAQALASDDAEINAFARQLTAGSEVIDLRGAPPGMGFSWGRYGPRTEVVRFGSLPIFAYRRPEKSGLLAKLFGR